MTVEETDIYKVIDGIKFGVLSPSDIRKLSVVEIQTADTYDEDGAPINTGLMDGRLGTLEPRQRCKTCGNTAARCPGHFGHIELAQPIIHVDFAKIINELLTSMCRGCGRILLSNSKIDEFKARIDEDRRMLGTVPDTLYDEVKKTAKKHSECPQCGAPQFTIDFSKPTTFHEVLEEGGARRLIPSMIRDRLERISDDDFRLLGFEPNVARPEWMVLQVLPIPPVYVRPSITLESGIRSEDDLTHKLVDIIRINQRLKENIAAGAPTLIIQDLSELLQYHITTYFNNEASGIPPARHRSGRALKTLSQRLKGKEGRFRSNLSGKRVDFSARTVISPDPSLDINEVGVPQDVAMHLTIPEKITEWNIKEMAQLVINGSDKYPGAIYVVRPDGKRIRLEFVTERDKVAEGLQPGFIIERQLKDGDIAIFNRQPSLHRMSIMAHYVRILPYKTFRLHLSVCPPYNADFDGDEMNLHIPQSEEARTEARLLMGVQDQILSPRYGGPIIGAIRDFITATFILTCNSTLLTKDDVYSLLGAAEYDGPIPTPAVKKPELLWTGKQVFSLFLPKTFNYVQKANLCRKCKECLKEKCQYDAYVVVRDGILECGVIDKNAIGAEKSESLWHRIIKDYGTEEGRHFLYQICRLANAFMIMRGFTYTLDELDIQRDAQQKIDRAIKSAEDKVRELIESYQNGTLERLPGQTLNESLEIYIMNELATARDKAGEIADEYFGLDNHGIVMTVSGARGSSLNIGQMTACVGQQAVRGKRIVRGYYNRALTHFKPGDQTPEARGFIHSCYRDGLSPAEFFFHAMGGREGLVDTAVRTQQSGYMQRRLINALEYLRVEYDGTVRDSRGDLVQFKFGEDGVDVAKSDHGKAVNVERLVERIKIISKPGKPAPAKFVKERLEHVKEKLPPLLVDELSRHVSEAKLTTESVDHTIQTALEDYQRALEEPGDAVGIIAAQSIGEPGTQMTLRTFHYAGVREQNVTLGLPRLIEIVDARRAPSTPIMSIYLDKKFRSSREKATEIAQQIMLTTLNDISLSVAINPKLAAVIVKLDRNMMKDRGISASELKEAVKIPKCDTKINDTMIVIKPTELINLSKLCAKVSSLHVKGVVGIHRVLLAEENGEWVIHTDGSNLAKVLKVSGVDITRTTTNNMHEIAETLGIEAARNSIIKEAQGVLEEQGLDVDIRHVMLVADVMTSTGEVRQIGRHGVSGEKSSILARAAFEITVPTLIEAASKGTTDMLKGVTENVIVGQSVPIGTGLVDLYMTSPSKSIPKEKRG